MAKNDRAFNRANRNLVNISQGVTASMDALYRKTYMSTPQQSKELDSLVTSVNKSIDSIVTSNMNKIGEPSVSKLYARLAATKGNGNSSVQGLDSIFDDGIIADDVYGMFMNNRYLKELDAEIDTICKYMPKLEEALEVQKDCVLSADHFSKDFLNLSCVGSIQDENVFSDNAKELKKIYRLPQLVEEIYRKTSKYGERFVYVVPYKTAIAKLLANKPQTQLQGPRMHESASSTMTESYSFNIVNSTLHVTREHDKNEVFTESFQNTSRDKDGKSKSTNALADGETFSIRVEINQSNVLESAVYEHIDAIYKKKQSRIHSMASLHEQQNGNRDIKAAGNINWAKPKLDPRYITANDGLIAGTPETIEEVDAYGCVVRQMDREKIIPIYIENLCLGYYYFEVIHDEDIDQLGFKNLFADPMSNIRNNINNIELTKQDETIRFVAGQISKFIDRKFVNHNQDLAKEIYMILKYNDLFNKPSSDMIRVTFIPPEDMIHFNFRLDELTHRGISDLDKSLVPAKIYTSLYVTDSIGHLTRGMDKRVYYVKQQVETNIAQTLLNTITQIKQGNFGIRSFQNINTVLNMTGRFNDYVIPTGPSGEPPIQFEVMPGQNIESPTELMDKLEEMAISSTGIPMEIIQARQSVDYAMQLTMSSSKVLRWCYNRQVIFEEQLSRLITQIYNYHFGTNIEIKVTLPPPSFINVTNTNQLIDNTRNFVQSIVEVELANEEDDRLKNEYTLELFKYYIGTHIDVGAHKDILERCKATIKKKTNENHSENVNSGEEF